MKKPTIDQQKQWMRQWALAARMLPLIKLKELREMTESQRLERVDAVLSTVQGFRPNPRRWKTSGLVQQQALFRRLHPCKK